MVIKDQIFISYLNDNRPLHLYIPDNYQGKLKVLYMFDGHNLFYDEDATYGKSWGLKDYLDNHKNNLMVVGIECNHHGNERVKEFCPYDFENDELGSIKASGDNFINFIINELKPYIDNKYNTTKKREDTFIAGSSMGGIMALYAGIKYSNVFSKIAALSVFYGPYIDKVLNDIYKNNFNKTEFYLSWGNKECSNQTRLAEYSENNLKIARALIKHNAICYPHLNQYGRHNEESWEKELPAIFEDLNI